MTLKITRELLNTVKLLPLFLLSVADSRSVVALQAGTVAQKHGELLLKDFQVPKGAQIIGYRIHLTGAFESVSNVLVGWRVSIENDTSGQADLNFRALPGASSLDERALRNIGMQVVAVESEDDRPQVGGAIIVISDHGEKQLPLSLFSFEFLERYHRHRLSLDATPRQ